LRSEAIRVVADDAADKTVFWQRAVDAAVLWFFYVVFTCGVQGLRIVRGGKKRNA
jgi:hypothetical protein